MLGDRREHVRGIIELVVLDGLAVFEASGIRLLGPYHLAGLAIFPRAAAEHDHAIALRDYMEWTTFFTLGQPTLVGSLFLALPSAAIVYFLVRTFLSRAHLTRVE